MKIWVLTNNDEFTGTSTIEMWSSQPSESQINEALVADVYDLTAAQIEEIIYNGCCYEDEYCHSSFDLDEVDIPEGTG